MNQSTNQPSSVSSIPLHEKAFHLLNKFPWYIWAVGLILVSGTIGFTATSMLLKLPKSPQCVRIFWPIASASMRIYCAQLEAEQGTVDSLLRAINLVEALSADHPLRDEVNRNVEEWAVGILDIAEKEFQRGKLEEAIKVARRIPEHVQVYQVVEERIEKWRSIWKEGEEIFAQVEEQLRESNWNQAFREAVKLLNLSNKYWSTTKYDETTRQIQLAQEESSKLDTAYQTLRRGGIDNWLAAIAEAQKIPSESYAHREAQNLISDAKEKLVKHMEGLVDSRSWQAMLDVIDRIPDNLVLADNINDWKTLANAGMEAEMGTVESLQSAIVAVQGIDGDRPYYQQAQDLVDRWKLEIDDVSHLQQARDLAQGGTIDNLNAAIASAELIPVDNPRYQEARQEIQGWTRTIQVTEDQPILNQARDRAINGTIASLQGAINQAQLIEANRALSEEAQRDIQKWRASIQQQEDQPLFDQAIALGHAGDYDAAIGAAQQIRQGRALYQDAQNNISKWRQEIRANQDLQEASLIAQGRTPQALISAITVLRKIPASTEVSHQGRQALNRWSYQLLSMAQERANLSFVQEALDLARMIPAESAAYTSAQAQIAAWKKLLQSPTLPPVSPSTELTPLVETNY